jgi:hypothetical protein
VRAAGGLTFESALPPGGGARGGEAPSAGFRRDLHEGSVHRKPTPAKGAGAGLRDQSQLETDLEAEAKNGDRNDPVPAAAHKHCRPRAPEVSVSIAGSFGGVRRRGVVLRHYAYPDAARAALPVCSAGLARPQGAWVGGEQHDGLGAEGKSPGGRGGAMRRPSANLQHRSR